MITPAKAKKFAVDLEDTIGLSNAHDKDIAKAREIIRDLAQQVEDLQADATRLNWMEKHLSYATDGNINRRYLCNWGSENRTIRQAIDEAMK